MKFIGDFHIHSHLSLAAEISNIYRKKREVRKVHNLVFAPSFSITGRIQNRLSALGFNITSDGRPIIGMDSRDLLNYTLINIPEIMLNL